MQFDDALPERFVDVSGGQLSRKLRIDRGETTPSPYIVKLTRDQVPTPDARRPTTVSSVTAEIEALAKSLIIDGDDDLALAVEARHNELSLDDLDISEQLREFDSALPARAPIVASRRPMPDTKRPMISLDDALSALAEPSISLDALVPIETIVVDEPEAVVAEQMQIAGSPWVVGGSSAEEALSDTRPSATETRSTPFFRFEIAFLKGPGLRAVAAFMALSFIVVLPLHAMQTFSGSVERANGVQVVGTAALDDVAHATAALSAKDFGAAEANFSSAAEKFADAQEALDSMHAGVVALVNVIPQTNRTYASVRGLVTAGQELSETASIMSKAGEGLSNAHGTSLTAKLEVLSAYVESAMPHVEAAKGALANVDPSVIPEGYASTVAQLQAQVPEVAASMTEFSTFVHTLTYLLGGNDTMRYLVLFQNNTELRPTGGFVGSFAEMDLEDGAITALHLPGGGSYDVQGQLDAFVEAPQPLSLINPRWEFQDGNWFPDFPTSAKKMQWFYEHAGGPTTDGVLAVNATFIEKLLGVTGPIEMPEYGVTIDAENFLFTTEKIVEVDNGTTATPKAFLGDLAPKLLEKIQSADTRTLLQLIVAVEQGLAEREIQVYFRDNDAEKTMHDLGYDGAIAQTDGDYMMVVNTNIGGGKTDAVIDQDVDVQVDIADDGSIIDTVTITKTHRGMANALFTGKNNVDYLRLYVPEGSVLLSADGFEAPPSKLFEPSEVPLSEDDDLSIVESDRTHDVATGADIWNEFGKTVFGGWMQTAPGETQVVHFSYRIPQVLFQEDADPSLMEQVRRGLGFDHHDGYSMFIQKQSGVRNRDTSIHVSTPIEWKTLWTSVTGEDDREVTMDNAHDVFSGWIFTR